MDAISGNHGLCFTLPRWNNSFDLFHEGLEAWKREKKKGGTPTRLALSPYKISNLKADFPLPGTYHAMLESGSGYWIVVKTLFYHPTVWISGLHENEWSKNAEWDWSDSVGKGNHEIEQANGSHIYPLLNKHGSWACHCAYHFASMVQHCAWSKRHFASMLRHCAWSKRHWISVPYYTAFEPSRMQWPHH